MSAPDYPSLLNELDGLLTEPVAKALWPKESPSLRLEDALATLAEGSDAEEFARHVAATRAQLSMFTRPIIAVLGQLNAGKSSVVSTFLSSAGRKRVPRGVDDDKGTHRFVYWVPASWLADNAVKKAFFGLLDAVHGRQHEFLSDDPAEAEKQYRSGRGNPDKLSVPLIAGDSALDALGVALLDCPDIQTPDGTGTPAAVEKHRLEMLVRAAQICSALLVVWQRAQVRDGLLRSLFVDLRKRLATAPLFLLLNKIDPEQGQPTCSRNDSNVKALLTDFAIEDNAVYGAFHFKAEGWRESTPPALVEGFDAAPEKLPQFFQLAADETENIPTNIGPERFLTRLPDRLELADLQRRKMADAWSDLGDFTRRRIAALRERQKAQRQRAEEMHKGLLALCVELMTDASTGEPRQVLSQEFTKAFQDSLRRTAPLWVRAAMQAVEPINWLGAALRRKFSEAHTFFEVLADLRKKKLPLDTLREKLGEAFTREFPDQGLMFSDPDSLAQRMQGLRWVPPALTGRDLAKGWKAALDNFRLHPLEVDSAELDRMTSDIWHALGFWQKLKFSAKNFLAAVGSLVAVASLLFAAVDGGATLFATVSFTSWLASILPGQILLAAAAAGGVALGASLMLGSIKVNTLPYLSRLFAFAADAFGLPRQISGKPIRVSFGKQGDRHSHDLPDPGVPEQGTVCQLEDVRLWEETPVLREIEHIFQQ